MDPTPLDLAHAAMEAAPGEDAPRLAYYARLADTELFLWLEAEAEGATLAPRLLALPEGEVALAFDAEDRLAAAAGGPAPYAALPGRALVQALAAAGSEGQGAEGRGAERQGADERGAAGTGPGLGINLGAPGAAFLLPAAGVAWLAAMLARGPEAAEARPRDFAPPQLPADLLAALAERLAGAAGRAASALLAAALYADGRRGHLLAILGADPADEPALARAAAEALAFSGLEEGALDVAFPGPGAAVLARLAPVALRLDLSPPPAPEPGPPGPPRPPRLR